MKIIDISTTIYEGMSIYPGNSEYEVEHQESSTSYISKICMGSHTGTHMDAPAHVVEDGDGVDQVDLQRCIGKCKVLDMTHIEHGDGIKIEDLKGKKIGTGDRILLKTKNSHRGYDKFYEDFVYLDSEAAKFLASKDPALVGIDYLSIKKKSKEDNTAHTAFLKRGIPILEGLDLSQPKSGEYKLTALPLKMRGLDASPVRAILTEI